MLDRREGGLGKAHKLNGVGCLHEKATSSIGGDAGVFPSPCPRRNGNFDTPQWQSHSSLSNGPPSPSFSREREIPGGQFVRELPGASPMINESGTAAAKISRSLQTPRNLPLS